MKHFRRFAHKWLYPNVWIVLGLALASAAGLVFVFIRGLEHSWIAYILYPVSANALLVVSLRLYSICTVVRRMLQENAFYRRYRQDLDFRVYVSSHLSLGITLCFCIAKMAAGIYYRSIWWGSVAFYYIVLAAMRYLLLRRLYNRRLNRRTAIGQYRCCGALLLLLTLSLGGICCQVIRDGESMSYPGFMIYAAAAFAFYNLTKAVYGMVRYARLDNPICSAGKILSLAAALVSLYFLQTAMISTFGDGGSWQRTLNGIAGAGVFLLIAAMAVFMIRGGRMEIGGNRK